MTEKLTKELFPNIEDWKNYLELINKKTDILSHYSMEFRRLLSEKFGSTTKDWRYTFSGSGLNIFFSLKNTIGRNSMEIWIEQGYQLSFWAGGGTFDVEKINNKMPEIHGLLESLLHTPVTLLKGEYQFKHQIDYGLPSAFNNLENLYYYGDKDLASRTLEILSSIFNNGDIVEFFHYVNMNCLKNNS
jgi:hypothetical protein